MPTESFLQVAYRNHEMLGGARRFFILNSLLALWPLGMQVAGDGLLCQHQAESALQGDSRHSLNYLFFVVISGVLPGVKSFPSL